MRSCLQLVKQKKDVNTPFLTNISTTRLKLCNGNAKKIILYLGLPQLAQLPQSKRSHFFVLPVCVISNNFVFTQVATIQL